MSNMSYCRFNNTLKDLEACEEHMRDFINPSTGYDSEYAKRTRLIELCIRIANEYGIVNDDGVLTGDAMEPSEYEESDDEDGIRK